MSRTMRVWWSTTDVEPAEETGRAVEDLSCWSVGTSGGDPVGGEDGTVGGDPDGGTVGPFVRERHWHIQGTRTYPTALQSPYLH